MPKHTPVFLKKDLTVEDNIFVVDLQLNPECERYNQLKEFFNTPSNIDQLNYRAQNNNMYSEHVSSVATRASHGGDRTIWEPRVNDSVGCVKNIILLSEDMLRVEFRAHSNLLEMFPQIYNEFSLLLRYSYATIGDVETVHRIVTFDVCSQLITP